MRSIYDPNEWKPPLIAAIGIGIGEQCLGALAAGWIGASHILASGARHLELIAGYTGDKLVLKAPLSERLDEIDSASKKKRLAVLCSGDPLFFGIGSTLVEKFGKERVLVIPNITSIQALCARVRESWDSIETVSFHGRKGATGVGRLISAVAGGMKVAVITDPTHTPQWIAAELIKSGLSECRLIVGEDLGAPSERVRSLSPSDAAGMDFAALNVVLVKPPDHTAAFDSSDQPGWVFGFAEDAFERESGMITKMEVRAVVLACLQLDPGQVLWDIGAATGSVSIEAGRLARLDRIFAVERNESRYSMLLRNLGKFGARRVEVFCATASEAIRTFADPDRVFIGGSGDDLDAILDAVSRRLLPGGRVVQTIVLLQTLEKVSAFWRSKGFDLSVVQLQVSRSVRTGNDLRLEALNPVFIVSAWRKS
jgi:precorrin-6Y C5,15-methyltransferase (decarboxylating)